MPPIIHCLPTAADPPSPSPFESVLISLPGGYKVISSPNSNFLTCCVRKTKRLLPPSSNQIAHQDPRPTHFIEMFALRPPDPFAEMAPLGRSLATKLLSPVGLVFAVVSKYLCKFAFYL
ncbi:hypothetical protein PTTG_29865 [Puccinia triticina 1-1 BBBD Race 1]|uniref:Uncharacterized protein n=1 Tax=Puccinia triticina (isolate 1-1 / race 1 (BBBD)) TaxID=630390 RepID=A0A180G1G7_PUCT1|nr:hypothetical protein PTTG_29865 [Puccinia triticina 1-1 BBBD Race 1]